MNFQFYKPDQKNLSDKETKILWESVYEMLRVLPHLDWSLGESVIEDQFKGVQIHHFEWLQIHTTTVKDYGIIIMYKPSWSFEATVKITLNRSEIPLIDMDNIERFAEICYVMSC